MWKCEHQLTDKVYFCHFKIPGLQLCIIQDFNMPTEPPVYWQLKQHALMATPSHGKHNDDDKQTLCVFIPCLLLQGSREGQIRPQWSYQCAYHSLSLIIGLYLNTLTWLIALDACNLKGQIAVCFLLCEVYM